MNAQAAARRQEEPPAGPPPVQPSWLRPVAYGAVILAHIAVFAAFLEFAKPAIVSLDSLTMDLVQEGDFFEAEEVSEAEDTPPPEVVEEEMLEQMPLMELMVSQEKQIRGLAAELII
jgi:protein TonB